MEPTEGCRLDALLVQRGLASGREKAKELLAAGAVTVNGRPVTKAAARVRPGDTVACSAAPPPYVGRGGYKLEKALDGQSLAGCMCLDVGASTGGFTDCMLQHGADRVYAVDVGRGQLHPRLRADGRVTVLEGTDIRAPELAAVLPAQGIDLASVDVSFISLTHVLPAVLPYLKPEGRLVCLIKPQFEAGRAAVGKGGIVRDRRVHRRVLESRLVAMQALGLTAERLTWSPITGGEGNIEYLAVLRKGTARPLPQPPEAVVDAAFAALYPTVKDR